MNRLLSILAALGSGTLASGAESRTPPPVDEVSQAAIQSAFQILRRDYIRREDLTLEQLNRAALRGLLERLSFGAELIKNDASATPPESHVTAEALTPRIACLRPQAFTSEEVAPMREALGKFKEQGTEHVILDLRSPAGPGEFETAAAMLELFLPKGLLLFKLRQLGAGEAQPMLSRRDPAWSGSLTVLVDGETNNLGETIAAVLRQQKRAVLVGAPTRGATVRYESVPIEAGWRLRFARAEVLLADDSSVFRRGLKPGLTVALDPKAKHNLFAAPTMKAGVFEQARPRFNEAALVSNKNPELDDYIRRSGGEVMSYDNPGKHDTVLQRAVDMLMSRDQFDRSRLDWQKSGSAFEQNENATTEPALPP